MKHQSLAMVGAAALLGSSMASGNLLVNPSFEGLSGNTPIATQNPAPTGQWEAFNAGFTYWGGAPAASDGTVWALNNYSGQNEINGAHLAQTAVNAAAENTVYKFSFDARASVINGSNFGAGGYLFAGGVTQRASFNPYVYANGTGATTGWVNLRGQATVGAGANYAYAAGQPLGIALKGATNEAININNHGQAGFDNVVLTAHTNLVQDPGFENGSHGSAPSSAWTVNGGSGFLWTSGYAGLNGDNVLQSNVNELSVSRISQNLGQVNFATGQGLAMEYDLSGYMLVRNDTDFIQAEMALAYLENNAFQLVNGASLTLQGDVPPGSTGTDVGPEYFEGTYLIDENNAAFGKDLYVLLRATPSIVGSNNNTVGIVQWDDIAVTQTLIPEPASLALLGLGGMLMLRRRHA
jgi:hypothetical protein